MKIAVASDKDKVAEHFGHCESFNIFMVVDGKIANGESIPNPGHRPGYLPNYLHDLNVKVIIAGGMGGGAIDIFNAKGIKVITGASGEAKDVVNHYLQGELQTTGSVCHNHERHAECDN